MALGCLLDFRNIGEKHIHTFPPFLGVPVFTDVLDKSKTVFKLF